jgi:hypothetical protein
MDLVGPLPTAQGNCKFAAEAVDYFTKWVNESIGEYHDTSNLEILLGKHSLQIRGSKKTDR